VLASHLIENIKKHCAVTTARKYAYVYYYCYFGHNQDETAPFLRWTISQLCHQAKVVPVDVNLLYETGHESMVRELLCALEAIVDVFDTVYIAIDAIDESMPRDRFLEVLSDLTCTSSRLKKVQLLAISRQYNDIENRMKHISAPMSMMNPFLREDIKLYVGSELRRNPKFSTWPQALLDETLEVVSNKAQGMQVLLKFLYIEDVFASLTSNRFRWATCQIHGLQRLKPQSNVVKNALQNLPRTLYETYERILLSVPDEDRILVKHILRWMHYNKELWKHDLSCSVLLQAIERSTCELIPSGSDYLLNEELLRELCGCLITVTPPPEEIYLATVSFAHYTVWEFLGSERILESQHHFFQFRGKK
jgi:hypothetical protein